MGIDARIYAVGEVSDERLESARTALREKNLKVDFFHEKLIQRVMLWPDERSTVFVRGVELMILDRYYSPNYPRGQWSVLLEAVLAMRELFPDLDVVYTSDAGGGDRLRPSTDEELSRLSDHSRMGGQ